MKIKRVLISVTDKTGVVDFSRFLTKSGAEIFSTGGTLKALQDGGVPARSISDVTDFPEILDGRVKTLHPAIFAGILAKRDVKEHQDQLAKLKLSMFDMVVVNLYRFEATVASGAGLDEIVENIDIGGPSLIRAAAKNYEGCAVVVDPSQYSEIVAEIGRGGELGKPLLGRLAAKAFEKVALYDVAISKFFSETFGGGGRLRDSLMFAGRKSMEMRYGENPHQSAGFYGDFEKYFEKIHGKELSYNNLVDVDAAQRLLQEFNEPAAIIIKHTNPCGAAVASTIREAYTRALKTDSKSAFGGIVAVNGKIEASLAAQLNEIFLEVLIAPEYSTEALEILKKKKDRRLIISREALPNDVSVRSSCGGVLAQTVDDVVLDEKDIKVVTNKKPTEAELADMRFAYAVCKHVKSNAIVFAKDRMTLGSGAGQMSRVDSVKIARMKAAEAALNLKGSVAASDAFFPFSDSVELAGENGIAAIIQPGGSIRDSEVVAMAEQKGIPMYFTGKRVFLH